MKFSVAVLTLLAIAVSAAPAMASAADGGSPTAHGLRHRTHHRHHHRRHHRLYEIVGADVSEEGALI
jgi:Spy/CpxP family protein refolding chaperone